MADAIRIQVMNDFVIYVNERRAEYLVNKSRKGAALIQYLIVNREKPVPNAELLTTFWSEEKVTNPENALKTLISRIRTMLNEVSPELGNCIVADRGAYHWECRPGMEIDLYEIEDIFEKLADTKADAEDRRALYKRLMILYGGDLLRSCSMNEWALSRATSLHSRYIAAVQAFIDMLRQEGNETDIVNVCRRALELDNFNNRLHMELMTALINTQRGSEAMSQYEEVMHLHYHYLNTEPSKELKEFYNQIVVSSRNIEMAMESVIGELRAAGGEREAFVCDYDVFKEIYNIEIRNIRRMGSTVFLGMIMIGRADGQPLESMKQSNVMRGLINILRVNLRKGDVITQFSPTMVAVLLPMVNYKTGDSVMERMKSLFYRQYPNSSLQFDYRISPVGDDGDDFWNRTGERTTT
ncbi:MAG: winged helix-turn-helix domain-containing protein [Christensenellaceae bacterium]|nr:winged helix-turn-helix domain-containing protein [Christensenellaceae bacterium]